MKDEVFSRLFIRDPAGHGVVEPVDHPCLAGVDGAAMKTLMWLFKLLKGSGGEPDLSVQRDLFLWRIRFLKNRK